MQDQQPPSIVEAMLDFTEAMALWIKGIDEKYGGILREEDRASLDAILGPSE